MWTTGLAVEWSYSSQFMSQFVSARSPDSERQEERVAQGEGVRWMCKAVRAHNSWRLRGVRVVCQGEPLAKRINTQASPASDQVFTVHVLENAGKLLQEAGAGEGERLFVCVIRSLRSLFPRVCARLARCARFFFWCA